MDCGYNLNFLPKFNLTQVAQMVQKDSRIKQMNEILNGIKVLKLYGWESSFKGRVNNVREQELHTLKSMALLSAGSALSWFMAPYLVGILK